MCRVLVALDLMFLFIHLPNICSDVSLAVLPQNMQSSEGLMAQKVSKTKDEDGFTETEARQRFEAALRGARITGHKPMTDIPKRALKKAKKSGGADKK